MRTGRRNVRHRVRVGTARALGTVLLLLLAACATPDLEALRKNPIGLPERTSLADVPFYPQQKYYCGPASLAMMLAWSRLPVSEADLVPAVYTPGREGSL